MVQWYKSINSSIRDTLLISIFSVLIFLLARALNLFEWFIAWSRAHEEYQLDEIVPVFIALTFALILFSLRRLRELKVENHKRKLAEEELSKHKEELEKIVQDRTAELTQINRELQHQLKERNRIEQELRETEKRFFQIAENIGEVFWIFSPKTNQMLYISSAYEKVWGKSCESLYRDASSWMESVLPEDRAIILEGMSSHIEKPYTDLTPVEYRIIRSDGSMRWIWDRLFPLFDEDNNLYAFAGIATDVTERKRVDEERLRRAQEIATLNSLTVTISNSLNYEEILSKLQILLQEKIETQAGSIILQDTSTDEFKLYSAWGLWQSTLNQLEPLPSTAFNSKEIVQGMVHSIGSNELSSLLNAEIAEGSGLIIPLSAKNELQGLIILLSNNEPHTLNSDQFNFLQTLGNQVSIAISNAKLFDEVRTSQERLQSLSHRLVQIQEEERSNISRELHDQIGQVLTGLRLLLSTSLSLPIKETREKTNKAIELINDLMGQVRNLSLTLRPPMLDDLGLIPTLLWHFERYEAQTGIHISFEHTKIDRRFKSEVELTIYRIVQESLTNVARYAGVNEAKVYLWSTQHSICVQIEDIGVGFPLNTMLNKGLSHGLVGMRERAILLGGQLLINAAPGVGVQITAEIPCDGLN
jgi:PAS domain S-box-containing protein